MCATFNDLDDLRLFLDEHETTLLFRGEAQDFIPRLAFEKLATKDVMRLVATKESPFLLDGNKLEDLIEDAHKNARTMFAICLSAFSDQQLCMTVLKGLLDDGLRDADLPFTKASVRNVQLKKHMKLFLSNQKLFCTAYFHLSSYQNLDGLTKPIKLEEKMSNILGKGAFGDVWNIEIHPEHRSFSSVCSEISEYMHI
jgi:hypothetical protein